MYGFEQSVEKAVLPITSSETMRASLDRLGCIDTFAFSVTGPVTKESLIKELPCLSLSQAEYTAQPLEAAQSLVSLDYKSVLTELEHACEEIVRHRLEIVASWPYDFRSLQPLAMVTVNEARKAEQCIFSARRLNDAVPLPLLNIT